MTHDESRLMPGVRRSSVTGGIARLEEEQAIARRAVGFRALLTVEFPGRVPQRMIAEHRWHLAVRFSNWIEAAQASGG